MSVTRGPEMSNTAGRVGFKGYRNLHFGLGFPTGESRLGRGGWTGLPVAHSVISHRWVADVSSSRFGKTSRHCGGWGWTGSSPGSSSSNDKGEGQGGASRKRLRGVT